MPRRGDGLFLPAGEPILRQSGGSSFSLRLALYTRLDSVNRCAAFPVWSWPGLVSVYQRVGTVCLVYTGTCNNRFRGICLIFATEHLEYLCRLNREVQAGRKDDGRAILQARHSHLPCHIDIFRGKPLNYLITGLSCSMKAAIVFY